MPTNYRVLLQTIKENSVGELADVQELSDVYRLVEHDVVDMEIRCEKIFLDFFATKYDLTYSPSVKEIVTDMTRAALHIACV